MDSGAFHVHTKLKNRNFQLDTGFKKVFAELDNYFFKYTIQHVYMSNRHWVFPCTDKFMYSAGNGVFQEYKSCPFVQEVSPSTCNNYCSQYALTNILKTMVQG